MTASRALFAQSLLCETVSPGGAERMNDGIRESRLGQPEPVVSVPSFLEGAGNMGERIRAFDWGSSDLGSAVGWAGGLRTALRFMLTTNHPVFIFWGEHLTCFYNDAYARSLGPEMHPAILGMRGEEVWTDIWTIIGPQIAAVMAGDGAKPFEGVVEVAARLAKPAGVDDNCACRPHRFSLSNFRGTLRCRISTVLRRRELRCMLFFSRRWQLQARAVGPPIARLTPRASHRHEPATRQC